MADAEFVAYLEAVDFTAYRPEDVEALNCIRLRDTLARTLALDRVNYISNVASLLDQHHWLTEFAGCSSAFIQSKILVERDTAAFCQILHNYVKMVAGKTVHRVQLSVEPDYDRLTRVKHPPYAVRKRINEITTLAQVDRLVEDCDKHDDVQEGLTNKWRYLAKCWHAVEQDVVWSRLCGNLHVFCERLGCTADPGKPLQSILKLRELQKSSTLVNELQNEMKRLNDELKRKHEELGKHRRIIACLTFRRILEELPEHPRKRRDYTVDWANFWIKANRAADENPDHPLAPVLQQFGDKPGLQRIEEIGEVLYGDMSTDIHHFDGGGIYEVREDIWSTLQCAILRALRPQPVDMDSDGTIKWKEWRQRFLKPKSDSNSSENDESGDEDDSDHDESDSNSLEEDVKKLTKNMIFA